MPGVNGAILISWFLQFRSDPPTSKQFIKFFRLEIPHSIKRWQFRHKPFTLKFFIIADLLSTLSAFLYNPEVNNLKIFFGPCKKANNNSFNKYIIYKFNRHLLYNRQIYQIYQQKYRCLTTLQASITVRFQFLIYFLYQIHETATWYAKSKYNLVFYWSPALQRKAGEDNLHKTFFFVATPKDNITTPCPI